MKGKVLFYEKEDIEKADKMRDMGLKVPTPRTFTAYLYFNVEYINSAYLNEDKEIVVFLPSGNWVFEHDNDLWNRIKKHLGD